jgi:hypothetical protein
MNKVPTETFQKHFQQTIQTCNILIDKRINKHLIQIKPTAPKFNALIKIRKDNEPFRPEIIHMHHPTKLPNA